MFSNVNDYITEKISESILESFPYNYIEVDNLFPNDLYQSMMDNRIPSDCLQTLAELKRVTRSTYSSGRKIICLEDHMPILPDKMRPLWEPLGKWFLNSFKQIILSKFKIPDDNYKIEILYTRDFQHYKLGPHTDLPKKVVTVLFYIPKDDSQKDLGTTIYLPKDRNFVCSGGPHYPFEWFDTYKRIDFLPNKMFAFAKSNNSFHGVEKLRKIVERDLIICDILKTEKE